MHCWLGGTELGLQPTFLSVLSIALPHGLFMWQVTQRVSFYSKSELFTLLLSDLLCSILQSSPLFLQGWQPGALESERLYSGANYFNFSELPTSNLKCLAFCDSACQFFNYWALALYNFDLLFHMRLNRNRSNKGLVQEDVFSYWKVLMCAEFPISGLHFLIRNSCVI